MGIAATFGHFIRLIAIASQTGVRVQQLWELELPEAEYRMLRDLLLATRDASRRDLTVEQRAMWGALYLYAFARSCSANRVDAALFGPRITREEWRAITSGRNVWTHRDVPGATESFKLLVDATAEEPQAEQRGPRPGATSTVDEQLVARWNQLLHLPVRVLALGLSNLNLPVDVVAFASRKKLRTVRALVTRSCLQLRAENLSWDSIGEVIDAVETTRVTRNVSPTAAVPARRTRMSTARVDGKDVAPSATNDRWFRVLMRTLDSLTADDQVLIKRRARLIDEGASETGPLDDRSSDGFRRREARAIERLQTSGGWSLPLGKRLERALRGEEKFSCQMLGGRDSFFEVYKEENSTFAFFVNELLGGDVRVTRDGDQSTWVVRSTMRAREEDDALAAKGVVPATEAASPAHGASVLDSSPVEASLESPEKSITTETIQNTEATGPSRGARPPLEERARDLMDLLDAMPDSAADVYLQLLSEPVDATILRQQLQDWRIWIDREAESNMCIERDQVASLFRTAMLLLDDYDAGEPGAAATRRKLAAVQYLVCLDDAESDLVLGGLDDDEAVLAAVDDRWKLPD